MAVEELVVELRVQLDLRVQLVLLVLPVARLGRLVLPEYPV